MDIRYECNVCKQVVVEAMTTELQCGTVCPICLECALQLGD